MNVNMEYKHLTDDEFYGEEISNKYYFKFEASNGEDGYSKTYVKINLQLHVSFGDGDDEDEFTVEIYEPITSRLMPGAITSSCCTMKMSNIYEPHNISKFVNSFNKLIDITAEHVSKFESYKNENNKFINDYNKMFEVWENEYKYS